MCLWCMSVERVCVIMREHVCDYERVCVHVCDVYICDVHVCVYVHEYVWGV